MIFFSEKLKALSFFCCLILLTGISSRIESIDFDTLASKSKAFGALIGNKMRSALGNELTFCRQASGVIGAGVAREFSAGFPMLAGTFGAAVMLSVGHDLLAREIYPNYFTKGYTAQVYDELGRNLRGGKVQAMAIKRVVDWLLGTALYVPLIHAARAGSMPKLDGRDLFIPACAALGFMAGCSALAGLAGYKLEQNHKIGDRLLARLPIDRLPEREHNACIAAICARNIGYLSGPAAMLGLCGWALRKRSLLAGSAGNG